MTNPSPKKPASSHPWKTDPTRRKVEAECLSCGKAYKKDPDAATKTCSEKCWKQYAKAKHIKYMTRGGFR